MENDGEREEGLLEGKDGREDRRRKRVCWRGR
jgi:hypothetical protein